MVIDSARGSPFPLPILSFESDQLISPEKILVKIQRMYSNKILCVNSYASIAREKRRWMAGRFMEMDLECNAPVQECSSTPPVELTTRKIPNTRNISVCPVFVKKENTPCFGCPKNEHGMKLGKNREWSPGLRPSIESDHQPAVQYWKQCWIPKGGKGRIE